MFSFALAASLMMAPGQWGPRGCPPVGGYVIVFPAAPVWEWRPSVVTPGAMMLFRNGQHFGGYWPDRRLYFAVNPDGTWSRTPSPPPFVESVPDPKPGCGCGCADGKPCECKPCPAMTVNPYLTANPPSRENAKGQYVDTHGVKQDEIATEEKWTAPGGRVVAAGANVQATAAADLADDSQRGFLVAVDMPAVEKDWANHPALEEVRGQLHLQPYKAGNEVAASRGYTEPGLYLNVGGKEIGFRADYPGPEGLRDWIKKRRSGGLLNPKLEINLNTPWLWVGLAFVAGLLLRRQPPVKS